LWLQVTHLVYLSIVYFILVININSSRSHHTNRICTNKEPHEIKKVTTLLYQSSSRVNIEPIPIVDLYDQYHSFSLFNSRTQTCNVTSIDIKSNLNQKRKPVLPNWYHSNMSKASSVDYFYQFCNRWHVSIFQSNLHQYIWSLSSSTNNLIQTRQGNKLDHYQILIGRTNSTNLMKNSNYICFFRKQNTLWLYNISCMLTKEE